MRIFVSTILIFLSCSYTVANSPDEYCKRLKKINHLLQQYHIKPIELTKENSTATFHQALQSIDPNGYFFLTSEIESLEKYKETMYSTSSGKACQLYSDLVEVYSLSLKRTDSILSALKSYKFDINKPENFNLVEQSKYATTPEELHEKWRKRIKYRHAVMFSNEISLDSIFKNQESRISFINDAIEFYQCHYLNYLLDPDMLEDHIMESLLDSYCKIYDPHSAFFNPQTFGEFINSLSEENYSFGLEFSDTKEGEIEIARVTPGGAAWKTNLIHQGDKIVSVHLKNGTELNSQCGGAATLSNLLQFSDETVIKIRFRKLEGTIQEIELVNEIAQNEENIIKSYILSGEKRVGYIALPGFYTQWTETGDLGCANDVGKELIKLKRDNIEGLILDLRYNGGGSVSEALALAGTFIGEGSLCIEHNSGAKPRLLKDPNRGRVFTGKMLVIINELSASASELTSGILKDHNRAIVVGSRSFGKGTGQVVLPLDYHFNEKTQEVTVNDTALGNVKLTTTKYYNLQGLTHQGAGLVPDIQLPDLYSGFVPKEEDYSRYIKPDSIIKKAYFTPYSKIDYTSLRQKSQTRVSENPSFQSLISYKEAILKEYESWDDFSLQFDSLLNKLVKSEELLAEYEKFKSKKMGSFALLSPSFDRVVYQISKEKQDIRTQHIEELRNDLILNEAYAILVDYINLN